MTTQTIEIKLRAPKTQLVERMAKRFHSTPARAAALLLDDLQTSYEFPHIFFHQAAWGREARVRRTGLTVWELVKLTQQFHGDLAAVAGHLELDPDLVEEALRFADHYPREVERAARQGDQPGLDRMKATLRHVEFFDSDSVDEQA